ncbi:MAG: iron ABC transporter permease [Alphaproteobacteria bacterium]|nr:iron ABC transporter permease [Alphaproteobacteria bacterium]
MKNIPLSVILASASVALIISVLLGISLGAVNIPLETVWSIMLNKISPDLINETWSKGREAIVWEIRTPRVLLACLVGAGLSLVGASLQSITRNPVADPHLLGISSGAAFGAILAILHTGYFLGLLTVPLLAFIGAILATAIVVGITRLTESHSAERLVLTGVAVSFVIMAAANLLIFLGDPHATHAVVFWMLGGLGLAQWEHLIYPFAVLLISSIFLMVNAGRLNALTIGDETAATMGINVNRFRLWIFAFSALITGVMVAFSGMIGFVGLIIPHVARMIVGGDNRRVLPTATIFGSIFLLWADLLARKIMQPEDMPIGILTGFFGGLFFIWLLRQNKRSHS